jgi:hypothetical protein
MSVPHWVLEHHTCVLDADRYCDECGRTYTAESMDRAEAAWS